MNINFNFNYSKNLKINGDIRYQIDTISLLKKNKHKINLGKKKINWFLSTIQKNLSLVLLRTPIISSLFNKILNYLSRKVLYDFSNQNFNIFSHYYFYKPRQNNTLLWSTQGIMKNAYYKNYKNLTTLKSDIYLYQNIDNFKNIVFIIWDKKFASRTKYLCKLKSPIKIIPPALNYNEKELGKIPVKVNQEVNILFIGSNPEVKGLKYLLKAIKDTKFDKLKFKINIISNTKKNISSKKINFYSKISENFKKKLLKECDIFILPTTAETFGYSILEAISFKCAIITTNFYPLTKFCTDNYNGYLVKNKNSRDIKNSLIRLICNKKKIELFKSNSFRLYKNKFSQRSFLNKINELNDEINSNKKIRSDI